MLNVGVNSFSKINTFLIARKILNQLHCYSDTSTEGFRVQTSPNVIVQGQLEEQTEVWITRAKSKCSVSKLVN